MKCGSLHQKLRELSARFDENPLDPDALGCIETQLMEIETQLQEKQKEIGAQGEIIKGLKDALEKRESLGTNSVRLSKNWSVGKRLQSTIPKKRLTRFCFGDYVQADGQYSQCTVELPHL